MAYDLIKISALPAATPDESQEIVVGEGDYAKRINYGDVKADMVGTSPSYTTDTEPYLMRQTAHTGVVGKCALNKLVGGSLGWNQLNNYGQNSGTNNGVTYTKTASGWTVSGTASSSNQSQFRTTTDIPCVSGHRYLCIANAVLSTNGLYIIIWRNNSATRAASIGYNAAERFVMFTGGSDWTNLNIWFHVPAGKTASNTNLVVNLIDLTAEFGPTIAEYIYSLESATAGVAWLRKYIDIDSYHAYDAGSIQNIQATAHVTTGFNQWDGTYTAGSFISATNGSATGSNADYGYTDYIPVIGGQDYYLNIYSISSSVYGAAWYDGNKTFISGVAFTQGATTKVGIVTAPSGAVYMRTSIKLSDIDSTCINISKTSGTPKNGDYVPYNGHSYTLGSDTLRGIPQLVSNKLSYDGDEKLPDGTIRRRYGIVDLGSLNWTYNSTAATPIFSTSLNSLPATCKSNSANMVCPKYEAKYNFWNTAGNDKCVASGSMNLNISDSAYTNAATFKTAMNGVYFVYPLETETTESSTSYQKVQTIDADGTESFTTSTPVPVGHETQTPDNILAALGWLGE